MNRLLLMALLCTSCVTIGIKPQADKPKPGHDPWKEVDQAFCDEVDACFKVYRACKKTKSESECFPPHEECVIKAYRKWKKARGIK